MLLFLMKHSRPDIANVTRELSKVMMNPTPCATKELKRVIKYVLDTKNLELKLCPNIVDKEGEFVLKLYSDSDWAGDKETCHLVTECCVFFQECPISCKYKAQTTISLSSNET